MTWAPHDRHALDSLAALSHEQALYDARYFKGADLDAPETVRRHVTFHLAILVGKLARVEERLDHGETDTAVLDNEVIPDLLVYAAQLAKVQQVALADAYVARLAELADRGV